MSYKTRLAVLSFVSICLLFSSRWLEASMVLHMAVQIPVLAILGALLVNSLQPRFSWLGSLGKKYRTSLLLFALFTFGLWMLPRLLDAALHQTDIAIMKWISLPMAGMALAMCWQHLPFVLRAVLHLEALATLLRLGWLYLIAPQRYCVSYGIDDQQLLGYVLLGYGISYAILITASVMFGGYHLKAGTERHTS
ncbi:MAG: hypothetical protein PVG20_00760 [Thioalkalispiraceae bacterium]|jgi:hypothetical protein